MVRHVVMGKPSNPNISFLPLLGLTLTLALLLCRDEILVNPLKGCGTAGGVEAATSLNPPRARCHPSAVRSLLALPHTHTTPSFLQVEEEDERKKKDSGRAHEVELLFFLSCSCSLLL